MGGGVNGWMDRWMNVCVGRWVGDALTHLSGIPVLKYCSILASILANEFFWVTLPEHASTDTTKYPTWEKCMVAPFTWYEGGNAGKINSKWNGRDKIMSLDEPKYSHIDKRAVVSLLLFVTKRFDLRLEVGSPWLTGKHKLRQKLGG